MSRTEQQRIRRPVMAASIALVTLAVILAAGRALIQAGSAIDAGGAVKPAANAPDPVPGMPDPADDPVSPAPAQAAIQVPTDAIPISPLDETSRVIVLPPRLKDADPELAAFTAAVRQSMIGDLRARDTIELVDVTPAEFAAVVPANAGPAGDDRLAYIALTRRYGAGLVVEISEQSPAEGLDWSFNLYTIRPNGGGMTGATVRRNGSSAPDKTPEIIGSQFAARVAGDARRVETERPASLELQQTLADTTLPIEERLTALNELRDAGISGESLNAAARIATESASAQVRAQVWQVLRRHAFDPSLIPSLSYALFSDADAAVRKEVVLTLAAYADSASAHSALEYALDNDSAEEVRLAARMAMMDYEEKQSFKRERLLDRSLTPAERIAPSGLDVYSRPSPSLLRMSMRETDEEAAVAYAEIALESEDPEVKARAFAGLSDTLLFFRAPMADESLDPKVIEALVTHAAHEDERLRRTAVLTMNMQADHPEIRAALEAVLEDDPALAVQTRIAESLAR